MKLNEKQQEALRDGRQTAIMGEHRENHFQSVLDGYLAKKPAFQTMEEVKMIRQILAILHATNAQVAALVEVIDVLDPELSDVIIIEHITK